MNEEWRVIENGCGEQVSNLGNVRDSNGKLKNQTSDSEGYKRVCVKQNGKWKHMRVHQLVARAFIPNPQNKPLVNHKHGDKGNNVVTNLEWCTPRENTLLASKNGQLKSGQRVREIIGIRVSDSEKFYFKSQMHAAREIGCDDSEINKCLRGKRKSCHGYRFYYLDEYIAHENENFSAWLGEQVRQLSLFDMKY